MFSNAPAGIKKYCTVKVKCARKRIEAMFSNAPAGIVKTAPWKHSVQERELRQCSVIHQQEMCKVLYS